MQLLIVMTSRCAPGPGASQATAGRPQVSSPTRSMFPRRSSLCRRRKRLPKRGNVPDLGPASTLIRRPSAGRESLDRECDPVALRQRSRMSACSVARRHWPARDCALPGAEAAGRSVGASVSRKAPCQGCRGTKATGRPCHVSPPLGLDANWVPVRVGLGFRNELWWRGRCCEGAHRCSPAGRRETPMARTVGHGELALLGEEAPANVCRPSAKLVRIGAVGGATFTPASRRVCPAGRRPGLGYGTCWRPASRCPGSEARPSAVVGTSNRLLARRFGGARGVDRAECLGGGR